MPDHPTRSDIRLTAGDFYAGDAHSAFDSRLHAYDTETGLELWTAELPASAKATPMSYQLASGDQYVAIAVGGGDAWGRGDYVIAFRLR